MDKNLTQNIFIPEHQIIPIENFINNPDELFMRIRDGVIWDKKIKARKTASCGVSYDYSGMTYPQREMLSELIPICDKDDWMHAILKEKGVGERTSLIFRYIIKQDLHKI